MLRLSSDKLVVGISPATIKIQRYQSLLFYSKLADEVILKSDQSDDDSSLQNLLAKLDQWLEASKLRNCSVQIILSASLTNHALLPGADIALKPHEEIRLMQLHFANTFGPVAKDWIVTEANVRYGKNTPIAALDKAILVTIEQIFKRHGCKITSIQTALMTVFNHHAKNLKQDSSWFVMVEKSKILLSHFSKQNWDVLLEERIADVSDHEAITQVLRRASIMFGYALDQGSVVHLHAPHLKTLSNSQEHEWKLNRLTFPYGKSSSRQMAVISEF